MSPSIAFPTVNYRVFIVILFRTSQAQVSFQVLFSLSLTFLPTLCMIVPMTFDLVIKTLIKSLQIFDSITDTFIEIFITFRFLMPFTIYFKERLIISFDNIDLQVISLCTLRVISPSTTLICTWYCQAYHVATYHTYTHILF